MNPVHFVRSAANQYNEVAPRSTRIPRPIGAGRTSCGPFASVVCILPPLSLPLLLGLSLRDAEDVGAGRWGHGLQVESVQPDDL
jgi:hypothetical protein